MEEEVGDQSEISKTIWSPTSSLTRDRRGRIDFDDSDEDEDDDDDDEEEELTDSQRRELERITSKILTTKIWKLNKDFF